MIDINRIKQLKQLREDTGVSISECKKALDGTKGDTAKAKELLKKWGKEVAQKKAKRAAGQGIVDSYVHPNKKIGAMIVLRCETDFVAKAEDFQKLAHEICLQVAAMDPEEIPILDQPWIKDAAKTVKDLISEYIAKFGENIVLEKITKYEL